MAKIDKLRVELSREQMDTHFYGKFKKVSVLEEITETDYDKRKDICPIGVHIVVGKGDATMDIKVDAGYFDADDEGRYHTIFSIGTCIYELEVFIEEGTWSAVLSEYYDDESFEWGDADNTFSGFDFQVCELYGECRVATDIVWDTDGEDVGLSTFAVLPIGIDFDDVSAVSDYLSDTYGYLVMGYNLVR